MSAAQRLDEVFGLPEGSEMYVLNDFKSSAYDAVRLFETLGLNQFHYIPFYPGAKDEGVARAYHVWRIRRSMSLFAAVH